jgi:hypothetical protein
MDKHRHIEHRKSDMPLKELKSEGIKHLRKE